MNSSICVHSISVRMLGSSLSHAGYSTQHLLLNVSSLQWSQEMWVNFYLFLSAQWWISSHMSSDRLANDTDQSDLFPEGRGTISCPMFWFAAQKSVVLWYFYEKIPGGRKRGKKETGLDMVMDLWRVFSAFHVPCAEKKLARSELDLVKNDLRCGNRWCF